MKAVKLEAHLVTLANNNVDVVRGRWYQVPSSAEALAKCERINKGVDTHTAILEYRLTLEGTGVYGDVIIFDPWLFTNTVEPLLKLSSTEEDED